MPRQVSKLAGLGHSAASCCTVPGGHVAVGTEGGQLCTYDINTGQSITTMHLAGDTDTALASVCNHQHTLYTAAGDTVQVIDLRAGAATSTASTLVTLQDEVNQVCVNGKGSHLATADDSGTIQVYDLTAGRVFRRMEGAHNNMCTAVSFRPHRPWEVVSGGMDMTVARWDFSRGKCLDKLTFTGVGGAQMFNPPFVHCLAVPGVASGARPWCQLLAVGCGDGSVSLLDADQPLQCPEPYVQTAGQQPAEAAADNDDPSSAPDPAQTAPSSGTPGSNKKRGNAKARKSTPTPQPAAAARSSGGGSRTGQGWVGPGVWDQQGGGHSRAAACVVFSWAESGIAASSSAAVCPRYLVSGGEDRRVLGWLLSQDKNREQASQEQSCDQQDSDRGSPDTTASAQARSANAEGSRNLGGGTSCNQTAQHGTATPGTGAEGVECRRRSAAAFDIAHGRKVNCMCAGAGDSANLLFVGDTSKRITVYDLSH